MFSSSPIWSLPVLVLVLGTFLSSSLGHTTEQRLDLHQRLRDDARNTLRTYDFNRDGVLDQSEFSAFYLSFFSLGQKRFVAPRTVAKLFDSLDIDGDGQLSSEEFRKIFKHWVLPLISTKSCLFLCLPLNATSRTEMVQQTTTLIRQTQSLFPIHYVYLSSCTDPSVYFFFTDEAIAYLVSHIKGLLAKAHDIKLYDADNHRVSLKNKDFDQFVINLSNVNHNPNALHALMSLNSVNQHPTVFVASQQEQDNLGDYLEENNFEHNSIFVRPNFTTTAQEQARYKTDLALILARKIYRKYKQIRDL